MSHILFFGLGFSAKALATRLAAQGWTISATSRSAAGAAAVTALGYEAHVFDGSAPLPESAFDGVTHVVVSAPPDAGGDRFQDPSLIKLIVKANAAREALDRSEHQTLAELAAEQGYTRDYFAVLLRLSYLAPDITAAILDGRQPVQLNRQRLARAANLPLEWQAQREMLGFA